MNLRLHQLPESVAGSAQFKMLASDAHKAFLKLHDELELEVLDAWHSPALTLYDKRMHSTQWAVGYSPFDYGMAIRFKVPERIKRFDSLYEEVRETVEKYGWFFYRHPSYTSAIYPWGETLIYLSNNEQINRFETADPTTWGFAAEMEIYARYGQYFTLSPAQIRTKLYNLGLYYGRVDVETSLGLDVNSREAILAFQRTWKLAENGQPDTQFQRTLALVSAEKEIH